MPIKDLEKYVQIALYIVIILAVLMFMIYTLINTFSPPKEVKYSFEVVGVTDSINASTVTSMHFECIKFCVQNVGDDYSRKQCYDECASLGKEVLK